MSANQTQGYLVIIGGAVDLEGDRKILKQFVELAGGHDARIVVLTVPSGEPREAGDDYRDAFERLGVDRVEIVDTADREDASDPKAIDAIRNATAVFLTGGRQDRICRHFKDTELEAILHQRYQEAEFVIGGTSAGANVMSNLMISEGDSDTNPRYEINKLEPGLGFLHGVLIDCHFEQRGRLGRLLSALAQKPQMWGLGLDENTAVVVKGNHFKVIGENAATIVDVSQTTHSDLQNFHQGECLALWGIKLGVLPDSYGFDIENRRPILEEVHGKANLVTK